MLESATGWQKVDMLRGKQSLIEPGLLRQRLGSVLCSVGRSASLVEFELPNPAAVVRTADRLWQLPLQALAGPVPAVLSTRSCEHGNSTDLQESVQTPGGAASSGRDVVVCSQVETRQSSRSRDATATPLGLTAQSARHHRRDFHVRTPEADARPQPRSVFRPPTQAQLILPLAAAAAASVGRAPSARRPGIPVDAGGRATSPLRRRPPTLVDANG